MVDGYDLHVGGGAGPEATIGRLIRPGVTVDALFPMVLSLLQAWQAEAPGQSMIEWSAAHTDARLSELCGGELVPA